MDEREELQALIERYNRELMAQYASVAPFVQQETVPPPAPSAPQEETVTDAEDTQSPASDDNALIDTGRLQVRVSTENQAIPLAGAVITVTKPSDGKAELVRTVIADDNGLTPLMDLPTKDRRLSLDPNHPQPYASYTVNVTADGYFPKRFIDLPIYGGVTAIQNVSMIPLPENGDRDAVLSYPQSGPAL